MHNNPEFRYNYYTNGIFNARQTYDINISSKYLHKKQNMPYMIAFGEKYQSINNQNRPFMVVLNDGHENYGMPCFQKTRKIYDKNNAILHKGFEYGRHWGPFYLNKDRLLWHEKRNDIVWRGAPTNRNFRIDFCKRYHNKYNIKLSQLFDHLKPHNIDYLVGDRLTYDQMCSYKFLISMEGNDKDSGLNWKLGSNSLVIMPKPKLESWLMEGMLVPWEHYVPLNEDASNLEEVLWWCLSNEDSCRSIVNNAHIFMKQFTDVDSENVLVRRIEQDYTSFINLILQD